MSKPGRWIAAALLAGLFASPAVAQNADTYPDRPVTIIIGFPPGGSSDSAARILADGLEKLLGKPFIIDGKRGAGGAIAGNYVASAKPDGYTLLFTNSAALTVSPQVGMAQYDPVKDFAPVAMTSYASTTLAVHPSVPAKTVQELIAYGKANPGELKFASSGNGTIVHLYGERFARMAGIKTVHVPYTGSGNIFTDVIAGRVQMLFDTNIKSYVDAGQMIPLLVLGDKRRADMPDVITATEAGMPDLRNQSWHGLLAPGATPAAVVKKIADAVEQSMNTPEAKARFAQAGLAVNVVKTDAFGETIKKDIQQNGEVLKSADISVK